MSRVRRALALHRNFPYSSRIPLHVVLDQTHTTSDSTTGSTLLPSQNTKAEYRVAVGTTELI